MKSKLIIALLALTSLLTPAFAEDTPLGDEMGKISKAIKLIKRNIADPASKDANVAKADEAKQSAEKAKGMDPAKTADIPEAEKAKFLEEYKASMDELIKDLDALKAALVAGNQADANKVIEKMDAGKKDAHKKFQKEE